MIERVIIMGAAGRDFHNFNVYFRDNERYEVVCFTAGVWAVLGGERTLLNAMSHLSGIATQVGRMTQGASGVEVLDTRKTLPGWRELQKYAVWAGGGTNHRQHLAEFPMVKDNHRQLLRDLQPMEGREQVRWIVERLREAQAPEPIELQVEDFESFMACIEADVDLVLVDNQSPETIGEWLRKAEECRPRPWRSRIEASGGITETTLPQYRASGVERVSLGALTHSVRALDLSLHLEWSEGSRKDSS